MSKFFSKFKIETITITAIIAVVIIFLGYTAFDWKLNQNPPVGQYETQAEATDVYVRFVMEAYDRIGASYWMKIGDYKKHQSRELPELFQLSLQRVASTTKVLKASDRNTTAEMFASALAAASSTELKKQITAQTLSTVMQNLLPLGRNALFSEQQRVALREEVSNIDPTKDLYKNLGVAKEASQKEITLAYEKKAAVLEKATSTEAKAELVQIKYAKNVLVDASSRDLYDQGKIEPTAFSKVFGDTLYLYIKQISPTTFQEFVNALSKAGATPGLTNMVIDLRGNIGGDLSIANAFSGLFLGMNQYAFDFLSKDEYLKEFTTQPKLDSLQRYDKVVILTDNRTQSTAELITAILKRFGLVTVVGGNTAGWGSVENTYPLMTSIDPTEKFTLYLVNSLTVGDGVTPIDGIGVAPDIDIKDSDWKAQIKKSFSSSGSGNFAKVLIERLVQAPMMY